MRAALGKVGKMKPLRIEINLLVDVFPDKYKSIVGIGVYNQYEGGKPVYEKLIECTNEPTEVMAYILKKYVIHSKLKWNKVTYKEDIGMILYGEDKRG